MVFIADLLPSIQFLFRVLSTVHTTALLSTVYCLHSEKLIPIKFKKQNVNCIKSPCGRLYAELK